VRQLCSRFSIVLSTFSLLASFTLAQEPATNAPLDPEHAAKMAKGTELFKKQVRAILVGRCLKCHGGESTESEFDLTSREGLLKGGSNGPAIVIGKPLESRLYRLAAQLEEPFMPEDGAQLSPIALEKIAQWIELGAPYDKPLAKEDQEDPLAWTQRKIDDSRRDFWSFQPLAPVTPPRPGDAWVRTPIDEFVLAKLREQQLQPNPLASRVKLVRRAYFDLIGLPPTPEEVEQFVNDPHPNAYARLIDRLLDSPHYGERWGRHWLDIARFAESHGFEQDYDRPHAYHFRDFVIRALNEDMPYDQFVRWQLAGDEIAPDNPLAMMATGFLGAGVFPTQLTEKEFETARYDELDDMVSTTGTALLGITIGCARCHDHKFDPIPSADYYRMISSFATAIRSNIELDLDPPATAAALAAWEQEHAPLVAALEEFERNELPKRFETWLTALPSEPRPKPAWIVLDIVESKSDGCATLTKLDDGSVLASGTNADFDIYTFVAHTNLTDITALRLEALPHASLTKSGPGRAPNGNFGLGTITVKAEPLSGTAEAHSVELKSPRATFQQNGGKLSVAAALDGDPKSGWAVDPQLGQSQAAVFETAQPFGFAEGTKLTITLHFTVNKQHNLGRPRLSISTASGPVDIQGEAQSQNLVEIAALLEKHNGELSDSQRATLRHWYRTLDEEWLQRHRAVEQHLATRPRPKLTTVMVVSEGFQPIPHHADDRGFPHFYPETFFLKRGDANQKQGPAPQGFLQVLLPTADAASATPESRWQPSPPAGARTSFRRRALAEWITDADAGAGQLLARVIVNRLWQHHLGRGIVATPNDFGFQGQRPTHPELLDWLARQLIDGGWRLKPLHKQIMTSAVYMQTSDHDPARAAVDPENQWLWRMTPQRLEAEVIRDAMLAVSGELDPTPFGPGTLDESMQRRSIYFMIKRSQLIPMMQVFDAPEPLVGVAARPSTTIAPQALIFLNSPHVRGYAQSFAQRLQAGSGDSQERAVQLGYLSATARPPAPDELSEALSFIANQRDSYAADGQSDPLRLAMADFCQVLFSLNEFVYVD